MAGEIGKASITIVADLSKFPPELKAKLKAAFAEGVAGVDMEKPLGDKAEKAGATSAKRASKGFLSKARGEFAKAGEAIGKDMFSAIGRIFSRSGAQAKGGGLSGFIKNAFSSAQDAVKSGIQGLQAAGQGIGQALSGLSGGGDITSLVKVVAIVAAIPAVFGLAGALVHLTGVLLALPAAIGVAAAALAPLIIGFQGVGEAIGAGFSGDVDKFNQALKGLAPSARAVAKEFVAFRNPLKQLKQDVQQALFTELVGEVKPTLAALIPVLTRGLTQVAGSLSSVFAGIFQTLRDPAVVGVFKQLFVVTSNIVNTVGPPLVSLFKSFFLLMGSGLPFVQKGFAALASGIQRFSDFLAGTTKNGKFETFLNNAINIGKQLFGLLGSVGKLIKSIFGGQDVADSSAGFIKSIQTAVDKLTEFFNSADGKRTIKQLEESLRDLGLVIIALALFFGTAIHWIIAFEDAVVSAYHSTVGFFKDVGSAIATGAEAVGGFFASIGSAVANFFTKTLPDAFNAVVNFFKNLPTTIQNFLGELVDAVSFKIGQIIGTFLAFPYLVYQAILQLPGFVENVINQVVNFITGLPVKAQAAFSDFALTMRNAVNEGIDYVVNKVSDGVAKVTNFINSLPGRVRAIGPALLNAARSLGEKIGQGLSEIGNFASNIGSKIVSSIKSGINRIIDGINGGIADIDSKIPISLPRLPHFERGGIIDSPTVALLGEKGKREVVLPLTDPARARELAQQSGLTEVLGKGGGAPSVNLTAVLDGLGLLKVIDMRVDAALGDQGSELAYGARS